jgi:hypothetical protein
LIYLISLFQNRNKYNDHKQQLQEDGSQRNNADLGKVAEPIENKPLHGDDQTAKMMAKMKQKQKQ